MQRGACNMCDDVLRRVSGKLPIFRAKIPVTERILSVKNSIKSQSDQSLYSKDYFYYSY